MLLAGFRLSYYLASGESLLIGIIAYLFVMAKRKHLFCLSFYIKTLNGGKKCYISS